MMHSGLFDKLRKLGAKDVVPKLARDSEAQLVVKEMMRKMVLLETLVPQREVLVMEEVMCQIVADVAKDTTAVDSSRDRPVVEEEELGKVPEGGGEDYKQSRWHDEAVFVHRQVMVNPMQQEVQGDAHSIVREIIVEVEEEPVQNILNQAPEEKAKDPVGGSVKRAIQSLIRQIGAIHDGRNPDQRDHPPGSLAERLQEVAKQGCRLSSLVVTRAMDLVQVEFLGKPAKPDLREQRSAQVQELVLLVVVGIIRLLAEILLAGHASSRVDGRSFAILALRGGEIPIPLRRNESNEGVVENFIGSIRVRVRGRVLQDILNVATSVVQDQACATGVIIHEIGNIIDPSANCYIARSGGIVLLDFGAREGWEALGRHIGESGGGGGDCGVQNGWELETFRR